MAPLKKWLAQITEVVLVSDSATGFGYQTKTGRVDSLIKLALPRKEYQSGSCSYLIV